MNEPTEREKKLINYIVFMISIVNPVMIFLAGLYKNIDWVEKRFTEINMKETEDEMVAYLSSEFGLNFNLVKDKDVLEGKDTL